MFASSLPNLQRGKAKWPRKTTIQDYLGFETRNSRLFRGPHSIRMGSVPRFGLVHCSASDSGAQGVFPRDVSMLFALSIFPCKGFELRTTRRAAVTTSWRLVDEIFTDAHDYLAERRQMDFFSESRSRVAQTGQGYQRSFLP